jgi:hypothetical protein
LRPAIDAIGKAWRDHKPGLLKAQLHHYVGVALAQQLEERSEKEGVWFEDESDGLLEQCIDNFLQCYQLCFPSMPTILLRDTCLWLALLLRGVSAHHFLSLSMHIGLMHKTLLSLGKKLR